MEGRAEQTNNKQAKEGGAKKQTKKRTILRMFVCECFDVRQAGWT